MTTDDDVAAELGFGGEFARNFATAPFISHQDHRRLRDVFIWHGQGQNLTLDLQIDRVFLFHHFLFLLFCHRPVQTAARGRVEEEAPFLLPYHALL